MNSDERLLNRICDRDAAALEELMALHRSCVLQHIVRIVRDSSSAEDLAQEVFLRVWTRAEQWSGQGSIKSWILRISTNLALNHLRSAKVRRWQTLQPPAATDDEANTVPAWMLDLAAQSPAELAELAEQCDLVRRLLAQLPEDRQQMLRLVFESDLRLSEVADQLGIPTGTAKSRLHYTIRKLTDAWNQLQQDTEDSP